MEHRITTRKKARKSRNQKEQFLSNSRCIFTDYTGFSFGQGEASMAFVCMRVCCLDAQAGQGKTWATIPYRAAARSSTE